MDRDLHSSLIEWVASRSPESGHLCKGEKENSRGVDKKKNPPPPASNLNGHDIFGLAVFFICRAQCWGKLATSRLTLLVVPNTYHVCIPLAMGTRRSEYVRSTPYQGSFYASHKSPRLINIV